MAALDPSLVKAFDASAWDAADGTEQADLTTEATNDTTGAGINVASASKVGKGGSPHGHILRVEFDQDFANVAVSDTVTVELEGLHNVSDMAMLPYNAATTVLTTNKIVQTSVSGTTVFTITQAFIDDLFEIGTDGWAVRLVEDLSTGGDWQLSEVDADITTSGGTLFFQTNTGSLTATGVNIRTTLKELVGSLTAAGANIQTTLKELAGSITSSGTVSAIKTFFRTVTGSITASGTLAGIKLVVTTLTGSITASGSLVRTTLKALAGSITGSGTVAALKTFFRTVTGSITATGALIKETQKSFIGSLTLVGTIIKKTLKIVGGSGFAAVATEDFAAANNPITDGANWEIIGDGTAPDDPGTASGGEYISGLSTSGDNAASYVGTFNNDQYAQVQITTYIDLSGLRWGVILRANDSAGDPDEAIIIRHRISDNDIECHYWNAAGTRVQIGSAVATSATVGVNDILRAKIVGNIITVFIDYGAGFVEETTFDISSSGITGGQPGVYIVDNLAISGLDIGVDTWEGGNIGGNILELSGVLTAVKLFVKSISGSLTPSGILVKQTLKKVVGLITPTGALATARTIIRSLAGSITASGVMTSIKVVLHSISGSITATGTISKLPFKILTGSITATGALVRLISKTVTGALTATGVAFKMIFMTIEGSITPSGILLAAVVFLQGVAGSITATATLLKLTSKTVAGSVTSTGGITKQANKEVAGSITAVGAAPSKDISVTQAGSLTPTGALGTVLTLLQSVAGVITATATLVGVLVSPPVISAAVSKIRGWYGRKMGQ